MGATEQSKSKTQDKQVFILSELLSLYERLRGINPAELRFVIVNETYNLIQYDQAILWELKATRPTVTAVSGIAEIDKNAPFIMFLKNFYKQGIAGLTDLSVLNVNDINDDNLKADIKEWLPPYMMFSPIFDNEKNVIGGLLLARKQPWQSAELSLLEKVTDIYGHDLDRAQKQEGQKRKALSDLIAGREKRIVAALLVLAIMLFPFKTSVLAPAEIIASNPVLIRAPIEGIIKDIPVKPNQVVQAGDTLVVFDEVALKAQIEVTENALKVAQSELRQVSQEAMNDLNARLRLSILRGQVEKEKTNLAYYKEVSNRGVITAPEAGTVVFEDVFDWLGRPVSIGERLMLLAQSEQTELEIQLPPADAIPLEDNAQSLFFSNARPDRPVKASVFFHSYRAVQNAESEIAYRLKARWNGTDEASNLRIGMRGTAKIYGQRQSLISYIIRKPMTQIRQFLGL